MARLFTQSTNSYWSIRAFAGLEIPVGGTTCRAIFKKLPQGDPGNKAIEAAARFGYDDGVIVPMRSNDNSLGLVCFGGRRKALTREEEIFLTITVRSAFEAADRIEQTKEGGGWLAPAFSAREIECLSLLMRGYSEKQIAKILGLSLPTVRHHFVNARDKSGATSRTHLAALAIARGFVTV